MIFVTTKKVNIENLFKKIAVILYRRDRNGKKKHIKSSQVCG